MSVTARWSPVMWSMRAATLEVRLEELDVLRSLSRQRVIKVKPYSEALFRTVKYRLDYPNWPLSSKEETCIWIFSFVDWYNNQHRHSGIKFASPQQRHCGEAIDICCHRARVYEQVRHRHHPWWTGTPSCWCQPEVV